MQPDAPLPDSASAAPCILYVDDEAQARKWFARTFGGEFKVLAAADAAQALQMLQTVGSHVGVVVTDLRMPARSGLQLLLEVQQRFPTLVRLLATAFAEKDVAIAAVNEGQVFRILEKPFDEARTRQALRAALALYVQRERERDLHENRAAAVRETMAFLAHELNTPLATVRGYMTLLRERHQEAVRAGLPAPTGAALLAEPHAGDLMAVIEAAERNALYCQSLVSTFVQSARDAHRGAQVANANAASLVRTLLAEFPFAEGEHAWVHTRLDEDFLLPGQRDLLYLAICTLAKNAMQALRGRPGPRLDISLARCPAEQRDVIRFADNGPGIERQVLADLSHGRPSRLHAGGTGMGLLLCRRVVQSTGGTVEIESPPGGGATVSLFFPWPATSSESLHAT